MLGDRAGKEDEDGEANYRLDWDGPHGLSDG
jgi:hypothetical protein